MKVILKRNWFDPENKRWRTRDNPHDMPDELRSVLPKDAVIVGEEKEEAKDAKKPASGKKPSPDGSDALTL